MFVAPASRRAFFNYAPSALTIRSRGRLPHWEASNAIYFVTFRLADSLPQSVSRKIEFERQDIIRTARSMGRELSVTEQKRLAQLRDSLAHFDGIRYNLFAWCVMPNHVHALFQPIAAYSLSTILHAWKSFSAKAANRLLESEGEIWQREYFDHLVRNEAEFRKIVRYILDNPKKAGLRDWPWIGTVPRG